MTNRTLRLFCVAAALALPLALSGCDREVSRSTDTTVKSNGTVKEKDTTVTQSPNGTVTKEETTKSTTPSTP